VRSVGKCTAAFVTVRSETAFSIAQYPLKNSAILDSGTTIHIFNEISRFLHFRTSPQGDFVWAGDSKVKVLGYGDVDIETQGKRILRLAETRHGG
jgi:hypothetical protein